MLIPYGGLSIQDGAGSTQALTTALAKMTAWNATKGQASAADSHSIDGDPAIFPDKVNSRVLLNSPGIYYVDFDMSAIGSGAITDIIAQLFVNGVAVPDMSCRFGVVSTQRTFGSFNGIVNVTAAQNPKTIGTFVDPSTLPYPQGGKFTGQGGAPLTLSAAEIWLATVAGTQTATIEAAHLTFLRVG